MKFVLPPTTRPLALLAGGAAALLFALWARTGAMGLTCHLLDPGQGTDVLAFEPGDPIPDAIEAGRYVTPTADPASLWQIGHMIDRWTATNRPTEQLPPANLVMRGSIDLPEGGHWKFTEPDAAGRWHLWIDGALQPQEGTSIASGRHAMQLSVANGAPSPMDLSAIGPDGVSRRVPARWLLPEGGVPWTVPLLAIAGLVLAAAGALLVWRETPAGRAAALAEARRLAPVLVVVLAMIAGTMLRAHGRLAAPKVGDTWDEYQEAWCGWSLVHLRAPIAWGFPPWQQAYLSHGHAEVRTFFGRQLLIVQPYMEHPPLFSILVGLFGTIAGAGDPFRVPLGVIRLVPLLLSLLFYPLVFAIGRRLAGREAAALACLLFAVAPPFVLVMRFAKGDLLVALLSAVSIWAGLRWREAADERGKKRWMLVCAIAAGLCPFAKELGIFALAIPAILLAPRETAPASATEADHKRRLAPAAKATGIAILTALVYPLYGAIVDWQRFVLFTRIQGATRLGRFEVGPLFVETIFLNWKNQQLTLFAGGWLLLWVCAFWALRGRTRPLAAIAVLYLATLVAAVDGRWLYGWYELPLYVPLAICAAAFLWRAVRAPDFAKPATLLLLGILPFGASLWTIPEPDRMHDLRIAVAVGLAPFAVHWIARADLTRRIAVGAAAALVAIFLAGCAAASWRIDLFYPSFTLGG